MASIASKNTRHVVESGTFRAARCGEFPNDNHCLHDGTGWYDEEEDLAREPIEVVDELSFDAVDEAPFGGDLEDDRSDDRSTFEAAPASDAPCAPDAFATFAQVLVEVAQAFGADADGEAALRGLLVADARARAWQGIILGESEDFGPCGSETLDEWAAAVVSRVVSGSGKTELIRRELRRRGVAAFGFLADAA